MRKRKSFSRRRHVRRSTAFSSRRRRRSTKRRSVRRSPGKVGYRL